MIRIEFSGNTTKEVLLEIIKMAELVKGTQKVSKPLVETREEVIKEDNLEGKTPLPVQEAKEEVKPSKKTEEVKESDTPWEVREISIDEVKEAYIKALHKQDTDEKKANFKNKAKEFLTLHGVTNVSKLNPEDRSDFLKVINENS